MLIFQIRFLSSQQKTDSRINLRQQLQAKQFLKDAKDKTIDQK